MFVLKSRVAILLIIVVCFMSCTTDNAPTTSGCGTVNLNLDINSHIICTSDTNLILENSPSIDSFEISMRNSDGQYNHSWNSFSDFPQNELFRTDNYIITASYGDITNEGFDCPCFIGSSNFSVTDDEISNVNIECKLANTMVSIIYTDSFKEFFKDYEAKLHSEGGLYISYGKEQSRPMFLKPGRISLTLSLTKKNGINATFQPTDIVMAYPQHHYHITLDVISENEGNENLVIKSDASNALKDIYIPLNDEYMTSPSPIITTTGFNSDNSISIYEGENLSTSIIASISSQTGIKELTLTTQSKSLINNGFPEEIDLANITAEQQDVISAMGLKLDTSWSELNQCIQLDFTNLVKNISPSELDEDISSFTIVAKNNLLKANEPVSLNIYIKPIEFNVKNSPQSIIGINRSNILIFSTNPINISNLELQATDDNNNWHKCNIESFSLIEENTYSIDFSIPHGVSDASLNIIYNHKIKQNATISRISPKFDIEVDAFANKALIKIVADNDSLTDIITKNISIYANDFEPAILGRSPSYGIVSISGLNPKTSYLIKATMMKGNPNATYSNTVKITTESNENVPDGDFEDVKERINCIILSGGKYSQTHMPIYNQQNKTEFKVSTPKKNWATVNSKTFYESSTNKNTWYLQPSTMTIYDAISGSKAMKLSSVAWDTNGAEIPDYAQKRGEYVPYNKNIPHISYRAAGKLFLGEYKFDAKTNTEIYDEGIPFSSRPTALNGYYKYTPSIDQLHDKGLVIISIINKTKDSETEIAHGEFLFSGNSDYTAFNVPLSYKSFGIKATHLRIMFASSNNIGSIQDETMKIITSHDVASASSIGSSLWIDNLTFSY